MKFLSLLGRVSIPKRREYFGAGGVFNCVVVKLGYLKTSRAAQLKVIIDS